MFSTAQHLAVQNKAEMETMQGINTSCQCGGQEDYSVVFPV